MLRAAPDAIVVLNYNHRIVEWNPGAESLFGYLRKEVISQDLDKLVANPDIREEAIKFTRAVLSGKVVPPVETVRYRKDGSPVEVIVTGAPILIGDTLIGAVAVYTDITERRQATKKLRTMLEGVIQVTAATTEIRDPYTAGHQQRVTALACAIAKEMGLPDEQIEGLRFAGLIHDIGKIGIPAEILSKPTKLSEAEFSLIKAHPQVAHDVLKTIDFPWPVAEIVLQHHERMDGSGYPQGIKSEKIILEACILSVADVIEAMASHRPYRPALGIDKALEEIEKNKGTLYDPEVVDACLKLFAEGRFELER